MKGEMRVVVCPECWRATDELVEFWGVEVNVIEERDRQQLESGGIDPGHKVLQVFVDPFEPKRSESGKDRASWRRWTSAFLVRTRLRGIE
jgi:hypothetical protein